MAIFGVLFQRKVVGRYSLRIEVMHESYVRCIFLFQSMYILIKYLKNQRDTILHKIFRYFLANLQCEQWTNRNSGTHICLYK